MFTTRETRLQDKTNRQNSIEIESDPSLAENSNLFKPDYRMGTKTTISQSTPHKLLTNGR